METATLPKADTEQREIESLRLLSRAIRSISQLEVHRKSAVSEYSERIKRLRKIAQAIQQQDQMGMLAAEGLQRVSLSDDDMELIHNPIAGM